LKKFPARKCRNCADVGDWGVGASGSTVEMTKGPRPTSPTTWKTGGPAVSLRLSSVLCTGRPYSAMLTILRHLDSRVECDWRSGGLRKGHFEQRIRVEDDIQVGRNLGRGSTSQRWCRPAGNRIRLPHGRLSLLRGWSDLDQRRPGQASIELQGARGT
jgi:hypothetical protein